MLTLEQWIDGELHDAKADLITAQKRVERLTLALANASVGKQVDARTDRHYWIWRVMQPRDGK